MRCRHTVVTVGAGLNGRRVTDGQMDGAHVKRAHVRTSGVLVRSSAARPQARRPAPSLRFVMRSCTLFVTALLCALAAGAAAVPRLPLRPVTNAATQTRAAIELFQRVLPDHAHLFDVVVDSTRAAGFDLLDGPNGRLRVTGSTGVDAASGLHWYIKYHLNASVSWERTGGNSLNNLPAALPSVGRVSVNRTVPWTYYQNVCTVSRAAACSLQLAAALPWFADARCARQVSYSMAWWNISRWTDGAHRRRQRASAVIAVFASAAHPRGAQRSRGWPCRV